ncbi:enoyl-CoA hydratase/isomerase family protein [Jiangella anatolica]|uniref:Enoyl-CoA hydratase n=1 Tax=Jiangella anatolica TaxID=2670374 RepID=A0A2W2BTL2_9ACTN|nr:enoyl-CoA hydratase-related protein [Jiangella anatolica]PZF83348.1 enoyl-CoA hydratase [Jiangella anatolica]
MTVVVERRDRVAWVILDRPAVRNAVDLRMRVELADALDRLAGDDDLHALVLTGRGETFCAGGDLAELAQPRTPAEAADRMAAGNRMIAALHGFPVPTVAAVHGAAAGAGCGLALACDLVYAAASARFVLSFTGLGLAPDAGASVLLPARLGPGRTKELLLLGGTLDAVDAAGAGLVDRVVPDDRLLAEVETVARTLADRSRPALVATKRLVDRHVDLASALAAELDAQVALLATSEHRAARDAFLARKGART